MKSFAATIVTIFAAAALMTSCRDKKPEAENDCFKPSIKPYPELGVVIQEKTPQNSITVNYVDSTLTETRISGGTTSDPRDSVSALQYTVRFDQIQDSTDAKTIRDLRKYLPTTAPKR